MSTFLFLLAACGGSDYLSDDLTALSERVAVLEAAAGDGDLAARVSAVEADVVALQDTTASIDGDITTLFGSLDTLDRSLTLLEDDLTALEEVVAELSGAPSTSAWWTSGSGTGTCAFLTVTAESAAPIFASANVEASYLYAQGQSANSNVSARLSAVSADDSWTDQGASASVALGANIPDMSSSYYYYYTNYVSAQGSIPLTWVFEIPAAGTYILRLEVTTAATGSSSTGAGSASAADCTLLAWQP